jgi:hypothetical protein
VLEDGETEILSVVPPGEDHEYVTSDEGAAVSVTLAPLQMIPSLLVVPDASVKAIVGLGSEFTDTNAVAEAEQAVVKLVTVTM